MVIHTSINTETVIKKGFRLDAGAYEIKNIEILNKIKNSRYNKIKLVGESGLSLADYPLRFKRTFCSKSQGLAIYQPSQILEINPKPYKYISNKTKTDIKKLKLKLGEIVLTRSGSVGKISYVNKTLDGLVFSDDLIRIKPKNKPGYLYALIKNKIGKLLLVADEYGSVINHLEPEHLEKIDVPNPPEKIKDKINKLIIKSYNLRDESNILENKAEKILYKNLKTEKYINKKTTTFSTKINKNEFRLDANYFNPEAERKINFFLKNSIKITNIGNKFFSKSIILPPRFKRNYIDNLANGYVFMGGKQILELDIESEKIISKKHHKDIYNKFLKIEENSILITRSGTIGKVTIVPKHWTDYAINEHVIRINPASNKIAGYLYCWLNSDFAKDFINKYTYGSVVNEIDDNHVSQMIVPLIDTNEIKKINELILICNKKRFEANKFEKEADDLIYKILE